MAETAIYQRVALAVIRSIVGARGKTREILLTRIPGNASWEIPTVEVSPREGRISQAASILASYLGYPRGLIIKNEHEVVEGRSALGGLTEDHIFVLYLTAEQRDLPVRGSLESRWATWRQIDDDDDVVVSGVTLKAVQGLKEKHYI